MRPAEPETLKVSTKSSPNSVAGAIAGAVREVGAARLQVVGAGALNQAVKAVAIARGYLAAAGIDLVCVPTFADIEIDGEDRTALRLDIEDRFHRVPDARSDAEPASRRGAVGQGPAGTRSPGTAGSPEVVDLRQPPSRPGVGRSAAGPSLVPPQATSRSSVS